MHFDSSWHFSRQVDIAWVFVTAIVGLVTLIASVAYNTNSEFGQVNAHLTAVESHTSAIDSRDIQFQADVTSRLQEIQDRLDHPPLTKADP